MKIRFTKMQGCGNDYVYINGFTEKVPQEKKPEFVRFASDRHFGIGGDGVIFINPSDEADFEMEMYNADGTRAEMCGNGIRCVAKYVHDKGLTDQTQFSIVSGGKVKYMDLTVENGITKAIRVDMGEPILTAAEVPVVSKNEQSVDEEIVVDNEKYRMTCVSMGNPHAVVFVDSTADFPLEQIGPHFENHERFPRRTNTEFVEVVPGICKNAGLGARNRRNARLRDGMLCDGGCLRVKRQNRTESDRRSPGRRADDRMGRKNEPYLYDRPCGICIRRGTGI